MTHWRGCLPGPVTFEMNEMAFASQKQVFDRINELQHEIDALRGLLREEEIREALPVDDGLTLLVGRTARETVGIILKDVEEVHPICWTTPVPDAPKWFAGLLNLGGEMVPVLDLNARITGESVEAELTDLIVICKTGEKRIGLILKEAVGISEKSRTDLQPVSERVMTAPFLLGVTNMDSETVMVLSLRGLLSSSELPGAAGDDA